MTVLRELVAKLGFKVDDSGFKRADAAVTKVKQAAESMLGAVRAASVGMGATGAAAASAAGGVAVLAQGLALARTGLVGTGSAAVQASGSVLQIGTAAATASNQVAALAVRLQQARAQFAGGGAAGGGGGGQGPGGNVLGAGSSGPRLLGSGGGGRGGGTGLARVAGGAGGAGGGLMRLTGSANGMGLALAQAARAPTFLVGQLRTIPPVAEQAAAATDNVTKSTVGLLGPFGRFLTLAAAGIGVRKVLELASDANETNNVLKEVFGEPGLARVRGWSKTTAQEMGRSEYALRDYAGQLGAMLQPMVQDSKLAENMSTKIGALAFDLASFFNTADDDALLALKAGLAGEAEPLRRFGIVLLDATLQEYALAQGIHKKIEAMTVAEKTQLRFDFIMSRSTKSQGDAARTIDGYANRTKVAEARIRSLGTAIGEKLMPVGKWMMGWAGDVAGKFQQLIEGNHGFELGMIGLAAAFTIMKREAIAGWIAAAGPVLGVLAIVAALVLVLDDVITMFQGGDSALGDFIETSFGLGATKSTVESLGGWWKKLYFWIDLGAHALSAFSAGMNIVSDQMSGNALNADDVAELRHLGESYSKATGRFTPEQEKQEGDQLQAERDAWRAKREEIRNRRYATGRGIDADAVSLLGGQPRNMSLAAPGAAAGGGSNTTITVTQGDININVPSGATPSDAVKKARDAAQVERRRFAEALKRTGGSR